MCISRLWLHLRERLRPLLTFLRMYVLLLPISLSISFDRSRDISSEAMLANVQRARPTTYMLLCDMSLPGKKENPA